VVCPPCPEWTEDFPFTVVKGGSALSFDYCCCNAANRSTTARVTVYSLNPRENGIGDTICEV
jgi:hypothetical protein